jgi:hypothetical protein
MLFVRPVGVVSRVWRHAGQQQAAPGPSVIRPGGFHARRSGFSCPYHEFHPPDSNENAKPRDLCKALNTAWLCSSPSVRPRSLKTARCIKTRAANKDERLNTVSPEYLPPHFAKKHLSAFLRRLNHCLPECWRRNKFPCTLIPTRKAPVLFSSLIASVSEMTNAHIFPFLPFCCLSSTVCQKSFARLREVNE